MDPLIVLLAALATYRVARMVALEEGPFGVFTRARGALDPEQQTWLGRGVNCPLCVGFWLGWLVALLLPWPGPGGYVVLALGLSGAATALHLWLGEG